MMRWLARSLVLGAMLSAGPTGFAQTTPEMEIVFRLAAAAWFHAPARDGSNRASSVEFNDTPDASARIVTYAGRNTQVDSYVGYRITILRGRFLAILTGSSEEAVKHFGATVAREMWE